LTCVVTPEEIARVRPQLLDFAEQMLAEALPRKDQRAKGELYLRGLFIDGRRKSMQPMAQRLGACTRAPRSEDLPVPGIVPDESELGEHHCQQSRGGQLPPGAAAEHQHDHARGEQRAVECDPRRVVAVPAPEQAGPLYPPGQLSVVAAPGAGPVPQPHPSVRSWRTHSCRLHVSLSAM